jgi:hypothetical protein
VKIQPQWVVTPGEQQNFLITITLASSNNMFPNDVD